MYRKIQDVHNELDVSIYSTYKCYLEMETAFFISIYTLLLHRCPIFES